MYIGKINKKRHFGFIEIHPGIWYKESDGTPWSSKKFLGTRWNNDGDLKPLTSKTHGYYQVNINGKPKTWHRLVYEYFNGPIPAGMDIDHNNKYNDKTDNRISNLKLKTHKDNCRCRLKQNNNTSGYPGVYWFKRDQKWETKIMIDGKSKHLGRFETKEAAYEAYLQGKIKYHGKESIRAL